MSFRSHTIRRTAAVATAVLVAWNGHRQGIAAQAGDPLDMNSIRTDFYEIVLSSAFGAGLEPGAGVNMSDPFNPRQAPFSPFRSAAPPTLADRHLTSTDISNQVINIHSTYYDSLSVEEEAHLLSANFKVSYGLASAEAAYQQAQSSRQMGKAVYFIYQIGGWSVPVDSAKIGWSGVDLKAVDGTGDKNLMARQFISNYGSHYVTNVTYGARISIRAQMNTLDTSRQQTLSVQIHAALGLLSAGGGLSVQDRQSLSSSSVSLTAEVSAGGVIGGRQLVLSNFDQIASFLADFNNGKITLVSGPIAARVQSYWPTLASTTYKSLAKMLEPSTGPEHSPAPFGVPAGTIVAWLPKAGDVSNGKILAPVGWFICDGSNGTPDLRGRFLTGTTGADVGTSLGSATHVHEVKGTTNAGNGHIPWIPGHQFEINGSSTYSQTYSFDATSQPASNIPPSLKVVFIIKQ